jgi:tetratricopeptide (TPR) repeat protein
LAAKEVSAALLATSVAILAAGEVPRPLAQANSALQAGEADKALAVLQSYPKDGVDLAEANNLECRVHFTLEEWDLATAACQHAVNLDGENSNYHMWLGRALGEKAREASFLSAYSLGKRVRIEFEEAVQLNPRSAEALADLGEFYRSAPGVIGGGLGKAERVAAQLDSLDPPRAHELRGHIAEEQKDYDTAEREFKEAIAASAHPAFRWTTLAEFYRRRERWNDMEWAIESCISATERDKHAGVPLYDGASTLIDASRDLPLAAKMLEDYLAGTAKTEEAPAFAAHTQLARVKSKLGDFAAAKREQAAALALAREYKPAQDLKLKESNR